MGWRPPHRGSRVLDAWVSYKVGIHDPFMIASATVLDLSRIDPGLLNSLADQNSAVLAIDGMQQKQYDSKFSDVKQRYDGKYDVVNSQFRNKLHFNDVVLFHLASGEVRPGKVEYGDYGKTKTVKLDKPLKKACDVDNITSRGMDSFLRDVWLKLVLHGQLDTSTVPFFGALFLSQKQSRGTAPPTYDLSGRDLNPSQTKAVNTLLSARKPLTLIHGPPGTGKTFATTAAVTASISSDEHHFYVLNCQTNAATRNLAVALLKRGVTDFKIVVSDNFFVEWHEDQYKTIDDHVIKSSETRSESLDELIGPRTVVLCSLSQLSNPNLVKTLKRRRVTHIVIDEASQIFIANLQHVLALYQSSLKRLTLVGDPKQLAPFGNERHSTVQSVFERLQSDVMLNIQYRMPCDLGAFMSTAVYKNKLVSHKKPREVSTVALINVDSTEQKSGKGITNPREADAVVQIIVNQFLTREFLVITPYNAQKELIADRLRAAIRTLHSQGKTDVKIELADERVHTVDTVQGQEADLIVFSAVRTTELGFLSNRRRMNVALTRAKDQLVIVAHMSLFRTGHGKNSLLGDFVQEMEKVTPVVNSKRLSTGLLLDFKRKPLHAAQGKQMHPAGPIQSAAGTSAQAVSSKGQFITPNFSSAAVDGTTEVNSRGKHWKSNQKKEKKKEELWQNKRKNDGYDARTETSHEIATKTTFEVTSFKRTTYKDVTETADQGATKTLDSTGERKRWVPRTNKNNARKNDDKLASKTTK